VCSNIEIYYFIKRAVQTNDFFKKICLVANLATKFNYDLDQLGTFFCEKAFNG
jgi:hypothetical protein